MQQTNDDRDNSQWLQDNREEEWEAQNEYIDTVLSEMFPQQRTNYREGNQ